MFRPMLPVAIALCLWASGTPLGAQPAHVEHGDVCLLTDDSDNCNRVLACVGDQGRWFNGRAYGRGDGTFAGHVNDGVTCNGTWMSRNWMGMGQADVTCSDGMTGRIYYTYQDPYTGTAIGRGLTAEGTVLQMWSGLNVLAYLRGDSGALVAALPCPNGDIPMS